MFHVMWRHPVEQYRVLVVISRLRSCTQWPKDCKPLPHYQKIIVLNRIKACRSDYIYS